MKGIVVVNKPQGLTSHDVVAKGRKAFGTRAVGHAGTLDPMATGVLVLAVGRATKLVPWLTADDKRYEATLRLGTATHSLDAEGDVTAHAEVPELTVAQIQAAADRFVGVHDQRAPVVSAIRVDGERLHARVRRGEQVEAPVRSVNLISVEILGLDAQGSDAADVRLKLHTGKGFYVRSFGRDLAEALGTVGHLSALERTASGRFTLEGAVELDGMSEAQPLSLADTAALLMPVVEVNAAGFEDARHGRPVGQSGLQTTLPAIDGDGVAALVHQGELLAVVRREGEQLRVVRGFAGG